MPRLVPPLCGLTVGQTARAAFSWTVNLQTAAPDVELHRFKRSDAASNNTHKPKTQNIKCGII